jgi:GNAT acetyltransferase-like protein
MNLAAPIFDIEVRSTSAALSATWVELDRHDLPAWNNVLRRTDAPLYQYPLWNEPYRRLLVTPRYLGWGTEHDPVAFVSILTLGVGPAKIGLVFRGPVHLNAGTRLPQPVLRELFQWARSQGYMFLRFTHSDPEVLTDLAGSGNALDFDAFPYFVDYPISCGDYVVEQHQSDEETLATFDREARRKIRRGMEAGYEFQLDDSPAALQRLWPLYQDCARRKHFRLERPLSFYVDLMRGAQFYNRASLCTIRLNGATVGSTLILRDRTTAHCLLAAFHADHRSAASFLHWRSMREMYRLGALKYNFGPGPGSLARFKAQFCDTPVRYPGALTIVLKEKCFRMWKKAFLPVAKQLQPMVRSIAFQRAALSR